MWPFLPVGNLGLMFRGHSHRHLCTNICTCIKALSTYLIPSSFVITALARWLFLYPERPDLEQEVKCRFPCLRRMICITYVPEQASKTSFLELIHFWDINTKRSYILKLYTDVIMNLGNLPAQKKSVSWLPLLDVFCCLLEVPQSAF